MIKKPTMLTEEDEPIEEPVLFKQASRVLPPLIKTPASKLFNSLVAATKEGKSSIRKWQ